MGDAGGRHEVSMPSRKPTPARRIGASTSFLPAICGAFIVVSGVSISIIFERQVARHLVAEQHADLVEELAEALGRALLVAHQGQLVLHQRMIDDGDALHVVPNRSRLTQNTVPSLTTQAAARRRARFSRASRRPAAQVPPSSTCASGNSSAVERRAARGSAARCGRAARPSARAIRPPAASRPDWDGSRLRGSRSASTPVSRNSPPLRYSARPVRPSMSVTVDAGPFQRLDQRIGQPLRQLVERHEAVGGVVALDRGMAPGVAERRRRA